MDRMKEVVRELRGFVSEREWEQFHDPKNLAMCLASEAGELVAEYRWIRNDESDSWSTAPENLKRVGAEAADVGIALLLFCDRVGIDLLDVIKTKMDVNRDNYPADAVKGKAGRPGWVDSYWRTDQ
jgi:dCTP diphosphatase